MKKRSILIFMIIIALAMFGCSSIKFSEKADILRVYSELPEEITSGLIQGFEKNSKGKFKIELVKGPLKKDQNLANSLKALECDIWLGGTAEDYFLADNKKMLQPYQAKDLSNIPTGLRDKHGAWTGLFTTNLVFVANRNSLISLGYDKPSSWEDLLQENFQQELVISDPALKQGGYRLLTTLWQLFGEKKFDEYIVRFKKQETEYAESDEAAIEDVRKGRKALTVVPLDLAMASAVRNNILVISVPEEGTSRIVTGAAIMAGTKQEATSRAFIDYLVSDSAKAVLDSSEYYVWSLTDNTRDYTWGKQYSDIFLIHDDLRWCVLNSEEIIDKLKPVKKLNGW